MIYKSFKPKQAILIISIFFIIQLADTSSGLKSKINQLLNALKPCINKNFETISMQERALQEIFRKEGVISHKDEKATRLIKIIREKNLEIKNLQRRCGKFSSNVTADIDKNWRKKN